MTLRIPRVLLIALLLVCSAAESARADDPQTVPWFIVSMRQRTKERSEARRVFILPRQGVALDLGIRMGVFRGLFLLGGGIGPTRRAEADLGYDPRPFGGLDPARFQNASFFPRLTASIGTFF